MNVTLAFALINVLNYITQKKIIDLNIYNY